MINTRKHPDLIYDVGMHQGEDTDYYLKKGFRVVAFEADPDLAAACRRKFAAQIETGKVTIIEGAIVPLPHGKSEAKATKFYKNNDVDVWGTVVGDMAKRNEYWGTSSQVIEVPIVNFAECLQNFGIPHFLKIDIEGMDSVCIRALLDFEQKPDYLSRESEYSSIKQIEEDLNVLTQLGYTRFKSIQQGGISRQAEPNPSKEGHYVGHRFEEGCSGLFGEDLPGRWKTSEQILRQYKRGFVLFKLFGPRGRLHKHSVKTMLIKLLRRPIPGFHDLHAKHSTVVS